MDRAANVLPAFLQPGGQSDSDEWATPATFFNRYDRLYRFTLDVCATPENARCATRRSMAMPDPHATPDRAAKAAEAIERFLRGTGPWRPLVRGPIHERWLRECAEAVVAAVEEPGDD